jgi:hypothetical protein
VLFALLMLTDEMLMLTDEMVMIALQLLLPFAVCIYYAYKVLMISWLIFHKMLYIMFYMLAVLFIKVWISK